MLTFEHTEVMNFEAAFRGMRNPKDSWSKSDSGVEDSWQGSRFIQHFTLGPNDLQLAQQLIRAGSVHRKFLRQIFVSVDITGPIFWWSEFDTYKVGTTDNSCSTMHTIGKKEITKEMLGLTNDLLLLSEEDQTIDAYVKLLNDIREGMNWTNDAETKNIRLHQLKTLLPSGFLQKRTLTMTYENLLAMCSPDQRRFHRLPEWREDFISWARRLPYAQALLFSDEVEKA